MSASPYWVQLMANVIGRRVHLSRSEELTSRGAAILALRGLSLWKTLADERLTTVSAEAMLRDRGRSGARRRAVVDQAAAVVILQHALDTERASGTAPGEIIEERD